MIFICTLLLWIIFQCCFLYSSPVEFSSRVTLDSLKIISQQNIKIVKRIIRLFLFIYLFSRLYTEKNNRSTSLRNNKNGFENFYENVKTYTFKPKRFEIDFFKSSKNLQDFFFYLIRTNFSYWNSCSLTVL